MKQEDFTNLIVRLHPTPWRYATSRSQHHVLDAELNKVASFDVTKAAFWQGVCFAVNKTAEKPEKDSV